MRNLKIFLWIFIIFLIQTVILARAHILGAVPSLVLPYVVCVMLLENEFRKAVTISVICAAAAGALLGRGFAVTTLCYTYFPIIVFALRAKPVYISGAVKAIFYTFFISGITEIIFCALRTMTVSADMLLYDALPTAVFNAILGIIIYPILKKTMYKEEKKKLLIGELV